MKLEFLDFDFSYLFREHFLKELEVLEANNKETFNEVKEKIDHCLRELFPSFNPQNEKEKVKIELIIEDVVPLFLNEFFFSLYDDYKDDCIKLIKETITYRLKPVKLEFTGYGFILR